MALPTKTTILSINELSIIGRIVDVKEEIDSFRPFPPRMQERVLQKLRLSWNYHSNAIEGNRLNYGETLALLLHGVTAKGKPLKDHLDIQGHDSGIEQMLSMIKSERPIGQVDIRELHRIILKETYQVDAITSVGEKVKRWIKLGEYKSIPNHVKTKSGTIHYYVEPEFVNARMTALMDWLREMEGVAHPLILASVFHHEFVAIHPFDDGNGRLARILMNFITMKAGFPPVVISLSERDTYYGALAQADGGDYTSIIEIIGEALLQSLEIQLSAAKGEDISDLADVDKKIALFKAGLPEDVIQDSYSPEIVAELLNNGIIDLLYTLEEKSKYFDDLFVVVDREYTFQKIGKNITKVDSLETALKSSFYSREVKFDGSKTPSSSGLKHLEVTTEFKHYRKKPNRSSFKVKINLTFSDVYYEIFIDGPMKGFTLKKKYDERISEREIAEVVSMYVEKIMEQIQS